MELHSEFKGVSGVRRIYVLGPKLLTGLQSYLQAWHRLQKPASPRGDLDSAQAPPQAAKAPATHAHTVATLSIWARSADTGKRSSFTGGAEVEGWRGKGWVLQGSNQTWQRKGNLLYVRRETSPKLSYLHAQLNKARTLTLICHQASDSLKVLVPLCGKSVDMQSPYQPGNSTLINFGQILRSFQAVSLRAWLRSGGS